MIQQQSDRRTAIALSLSAMLLFPLLVFQAIFFLFPDKRQQFFPYLHEFRVKLDFNELQRLEEVEHEGAQQVLAGKHVVKSWPQLPPQIQPAADDAKTEEDEKKISLVPNAKSPSPTAPRKKGQPVKFVKTKIQGVPLYETIVDLTDPETFMTIELANNASQANCAGSTAGDESFDSLVKKAHAAVVQNGTFFSKDDEKRVMGNMVNCGRYLKYSPWENYGTTLGIKRNNQLEMVTARVDGQPDWSQHWFSLTCGPRLLRDGEVIVDAEGEGFSDSHVLGVGPRCAIGYTKDQKKIHIVVFLQGLSLKKEGELMKALGCWQAMNLDGGASRALAHNGQIIVPANRPLTNVLVVYDSAHKAPQSVIASWQAFQQRPEETITASGW